MLVITAAYQTIKVSVVAEILQCCKSDLETSSRFSSFPSQLVKQKKIIISRNLIEEKLPLEFPNEVGFKSGHFPDISGMIEIKGECQAGHLKGKLSQLL